MNEFNNSHKERNSDLGLQEMFKNTKEAKYKGNDDATDTDENHSPYFTHNTK